MKQFILAVLLCVAGRSWAQTSGVTISGQVKEQKTDAAIPYANVVLKTEKDSAFVAGTVTDDNGRFSLTGVASGDYNITVSFTGFLPKTMPITIGRLSSFIDAGIIALPEDDKMLAEVAVTAKTDDISSKMDKKTFNVAENISQAGSSVADVMKALPGVTVNDGKVQLRGNDKVMVLIDGKQTALTGFGGQSGLDNIPASAIEKIEIVNNPSAKFDANGNAGIINIIYKKEKKEGFNGKVGLTGGLGALWIKQQNLPGIRPQYQATPKLNPSLSLNYRKNKVNVFLQADDLYTHTLNKNEFVDRRYDDGSVVRQQTKRNRNTNIITTRAGVDWYADEANTLTVSGLFSSEKILDNGDEPFFNEDLSQRLRLWQFIEDELKTTATAFTHWQHKFAQPGRVLNADINYTYHRENEQYFFTNILPTYTGLDSFKLISDEHVFDAGVDYTQPLRYGHIDGGVKFRRRYIPVNMLFIPGLNSPLDVNAGGWANYGETIPALYANYVYESKTLEMEMGMRVEHVNIQYDVNPGHNTYKSDGYSYTQPFPNFRLAYKLDDRNSVSLFYNRRVDRPNEVDIRIFPKYDDAEIVKVGNPELRPQFTNSLEAGYRSSWGSGYIYSALYYKMINATITRIASIAPGSTIIYNIFQNAGKSNQAGIEMSVSQSIGKLATLNLNMNGYNNTIDAFSVQNKYPVQSVFSAPKQEMFSGNVKLNGVFHFSGGVDAQLTALYLAPDVVPQGKIDSRFSVDVGLKKSIQKGKGELFMNISDLANTLNVRRTVTGDGFSYTSADYYETQVLRVGYNVKF